MTSKFSIDNKELLQRISSGEAVVGIDFGNLIVRELAAFRLAAMDSKTHDAINFDEWSRKCALQITLCYPDFREKAQYIWNSARETQHSTPKEVNAEDCPAFVRYDITEVDEAWARGFNACRAAMLQAGNCRENRNSSTNNCREIAETSTGTAITPAAPDKKLTDDVLDEIIAGAKTSMEQYLALSLKAEREVWRKEGPTDDERIMAIEGIHSCERCGDEGWVVGEMGITRCACGQAGNSPGINGAEQRIADAVELLKQAAPAMLADNNGPNGPLAGRLKSPVIPEGYVMVPKEPTDEMLAASYMFAHVDATRESWLAMLAAAPQEVKGE